MQKTADMNVPRRHGFGVVMGYALSGWLLPDFEPIAVIPSGTRLTAFHSEKVKSSTTMTSRAGSGGAGVGRHGHGGA
ncbi:hypothetical protein [Actinophytocola sp.]|uniref:hypothetical protein n=1 Tax=Actinophytocola sp. TaxID=1872138 RepID=UPI002D3552EA|nr:hypothetical protein [Actinophytocola sp.]HYQ63069.1 hypothetical protein [Actinophytocola sp.]